MPSQAVRQALVEPGRQQTRVPLESPARARDWMVEVPMSASEICRNRLAEAVHLLVQQAGHRFRGAVAAGETGAAGDQHDLHAILGDPGRDLCADPV